MSLEFHKNDSEETICRGCNRRNTAFAGRDMPVRPGVESARHAMLQVHVLHGAESPSVLQEHGNTCRCKHAACTARFLAGACGCCDRISTYGRYCPVDRFAVRCSTTGAATLSSRTLRPS